MDSTPAPQYRWYPLEALSGWLLPGLCHILLGQRARGLTLMVTIITLWLSGLLIGGVTVIDQSKNMPGWFLGQMLIAPSFAVNYYRAHYLVQDPPSRPGPNAAYEPSFARIYEQGILYTSLAGMLNLLAMVDVLYNDPRRRHRVPGIPDPAETSVPPPSASPLGPPPPTSTL